jgi:hypothetical protein
MKNNISFLSFILFFTATGSSACEVVMTGDATSIENAAHSPVSILSHSFLSIHPPHSAGGTHQSNYIDHVGNSPRRTHAPSLFPTVFSRLSACELLDRNEHPAIHLSHCGPNHPGLCGLRSVILLN